MHQLSYNIQIYSSSTDSYANINHYHRRRHHHHHRTPPLRDRDSAAAYTSHHEKKIQNIVVGLNWFNDVINRSQKIIIIINVYDIFYRKPS